MAEEQRFESVSCPECGMFATVRLGLTGVVKTELGDIGSGCRHRLIGTAVLACSSFRPAILAGQKRLRGDSSARVGGWLSGGDFQPRPAT
jgi:hypothetical protein